jgi:hypothetical protein
VLHSIHSASQADKLQFGGDGFPVQKFDIRVFAVQNMWSANKEYPCKDAILRAADPRELGMKLLTPRFEALLGNSLKGHRHG